MLTRVIIAVHKYIAVYLPKILKNYIVIYTTMYATKLYILVERKQY